MISVVKLIGREAMFRYDEHGDPLYSPREKILLALRWYEWIDPSDLYDQLGLELSSRERNSFGKALERLIERGVVERKMFGDWSSCRKKNKKFVRSFVRLSPKANASKLRRRARA